MASHLMSNATRWVVFCAWWWTLWQCLSEMIQGNDQDDELIVFLAYPAQDNCQNTWSSMLMHSSCEMSIDVHLKLINKPPWSEQWKRIPQITQTNENTYKCRHARIQHMQTHAFKQINYVHGMTMSDYVIVKNNVALICQSSLSLIII